MRVERAPYPVESLGVFGMGGVGQHRLKLLIPPEAADILGRTRPLPGHTPWIAHTRLRREDLFHGDLMVPVVAEVVHTENTLLATERDILRQAAKYFAGETRW